MRFQRAGRQRGFTLIEVLVVVSIVAILSSIAIPMYLDYRARAYNSAAVTDLKNIRNTMEAYFAENQLYPSF